jgi:15-cis-phytoene synthase
MDLALHLAELPAERRLALAYAPKAAQPVFLGLLALDTRLAGIVRQAREPLLGQLKLSWWRDRLKAEAAPGALGDPLLELLGQWGPHRAALVRLVDGWEHLLNEEQLGKAALIAFAEARGMVCAELAERLGEPEAIPEAGRAGRNWALADLALGLSDPAEIELVTGIIRTQDWRPVKLPRALRPLTVLHGLAARKQGAAPLLAGPRDGLFAVRLGLLGF